MKDEILPGQNYSEAKHPEYGGSAEASAREMVPRRDAGASNCTSVLGKGLSGLCRHAAKTCRAVTVAVEFGSSA